MNFLRTFALLIIFSLKIAAGELPGYTSASAVITAKSNTQLIINPINFGSLIYKEVSPNLQGLMFHNKKPAGITSLLQWNGKMKFKISRNMNIIFTYN